MQGIINEVIFLGRTLQIFSNKTVSRQAMTNLEAMFKGHYIQKGQYEILNEKLPKSNDEICSEVKEYLDLILTLKDELRAPKIKDDKVGNEIFKKLERTTELEEEFSEHFLPWWETQRLYGRWFLFFKDDIEKAITCYINACNGVGYTGGPSAKSIFRGAIILCSIAYRKEIKKAEGKSIGSILKRLKNQASVLGVHFPWLEDQRDFSPLEKELCSSYQHQYFPGYRE